MERSYGRPGYRVVWREYYEADPRSGQPVLKLIFPEHQRIKPPSWRARLAELRDWALFLVFAAVVAASLMVGVQ